MSQRTWCVWICFCFVACASCSPGKHSVPPASSGSAGRNASTAGHISGIAGKPAPVPVGTVQGDAAALSTDTQAFLMKITSDLVAARQQASDQFQEQHALPLSNGISYDAAHAQNLDLIQASTLKLTSQELVVLAKQGFVISARQSFPTFAYGYTSIYAADLPVYISADSIAEALHRSYDKILSNIERSFVRIELHELLVSLRKTLAANPASAARSDLDTYLTVAQSLLDYGTRSAPSLLVGAGGNQAAVDTLVASAMAGEGTQIVKLFGVEREEDFSQFKPRGHYEDDPALQTYFRTMMWLGRVDFRLVETIDETGNQVLRRPQVDAMLLLHALFSSVELARFHRVDDVLRAFVGESDNMTITQVPDLLAALGVKDAASVAKIPDDQLKQQILATGFGKQQIMSSLMVGGLDAAVPLNVSFLLFGQRYIVDSHVLANVTWDRVRKKRMMPDPLDVAFAALSNDQAASLLKDQLEKYSYFGDLAAMRTLVDTHDESFWHQNLYNDWLSALRALSPVRSLVSDPKAAGMPSITASEAWGRRMLNTQLASWAQLRHDTLLYAKQSYTAEAVCHFPDAAVDPYPEFYAAVARFAEHGLELAKLTEGMTAQAMGDSLRDYFVQMRDVARMLQSIAEAELSSTALSAEQMAFINDAVVINKVSAGCTSVDMVSGWYARLFYDQDSALDFDPTVADVHTQATDEIGNPIGRILHVATGYPRLMVVTDDGCGTPKAYVGLASSYYEQVTEDWLRMTDSEWAPRVRSNMALDDVQWMRDLVLH